MIRRLPVVVAIVALVSASVPGCGGGIDEGIPEDVDMTKHYAPAAQTGAFDYRQMGKDTASSKVAPGP